MNKRSCCFVFLLVVFRSSTSSSGLLLLRMPQYELWMSHVTCHMSHECHTEWRAPTTTTFLCIWRCSNGIVMVGVRGIAITTTRGWIGWGWIETINSFGRNTGRRQSHGSQEFHRWQQRREREAQKIFLCLTNTRQDRRFGLTKVGRFWSGRSEFLCQLV